MITYKNLGGPANGNLGNSLFQIASTIGLAIKYGREYGFPQWKNSVYFKNPLPLNRGKNLPTVQEQAYHFTPGYWDIKAGENPTIMDINGWLQSEKYFENAKNEVKTAFEFEEKFKTKLLEKYQDVFSRPTIGISIRRGDFVGNSNYEQLPISYYVGALTKHFPNYQDYNLFFFSDDIAFCKHHFECLDNAFFPRNLSTPIEQLCLLSHCDNFIISNSTFSWWGAWLGEKENTQIIRPNYNLAGDLKKNNDDKDYYPERWMIYDHKKEKINLTDVTFTIPTHYDHEDRAQNLRLTLKYLNTHFQTNIIVGEQGGLHFKDIGCRYISYPYSRFHRTKMLNEMAILSETPIIVNYDADVIIPPMQIVESVRLLRGSTDMVYPYDGRFARVDRKKWYTKLRDSLDTEIFKQEILPGARKTDHGSVGGAVFFKKISFYEGGMENENFISYAPEDQERYFRFQKLGYNVTRVKGQIYHMDHFVGENSHTNHSLYKDNEKEFFRVRAIQDLRSEVLTWSWYRNYSNEYYAEILGGSTLSRDEFFKIPEVIHNVKTIIDVSCGIGHWGKDLQNYEYYGTDLKIPQHLLVIPQDRYKEYDLTSNDKFPFPGKFDLCLNLEVMEHISEEHAEKCIKLLTSLSDKVLFSAAIPMQGGVDHKNEQFQTYWASLFEKEGFYPINLNIKNNPNIEVWYRQNAVLYVKKPTNQVVEDYVHPEMYTNVLGTLTNWRNIKPYKKEKTLQ